ncbi:MAG: right-handed parallel beta-helix repeat-containing protein [Planctomycetota bacterium]|jgi:parallel beta-helix repeat protein
MSYNLAYTGAQADKAIELSIPANTRIINVKDSDYNAKGDGVTDDTAALKAAATAASGEVLYIPKSSSHYLFSSSADGTKIMEVGNNTTVIIDGEIRQKSTDTKGAIVLANDDWTNGNDNIHIVGRGGVIDCNNRNVGSTHFSPGIALRRVTECSVKGVQVRDTTGPGINIERPGGRIVITENIIDGDPADSGTPTGCDGCITIQDAVTPGPSQIIISNNVSRYTLEGIGANAQNAVTNNGELIITGNSINNVSTGDGITMAGFSNFVISNNSVKTVKNSGIAARFYDSGAGAGTDSQNGVIQGNFIGDAGATATAGQDAHGIKLGRSSSTDDSYMVVANNTIIDAGNATAGGDGIRVSLNTHHVAINGNVIKDANASGIYLAGTSGNEIENVTITGNVVDGCGQSGILALYADYLTIGSNTCYDNGSSNTNPEGIHIEDCDYFSITGNMCSDTATVQDYGLKLVDTVANGVIVGNNFEGNNTGALSGVGKLTDGTFQLNSPSVNVFESFSAASGNLSLNIPTKINSTNNAVDATLPDGTYQGQIKVITMVEASNPSTVSITSHLTSDPEVATFDALEETGVFMWVDTVWITLYATCTFV